MLHMARKTDRNQVYEDGIGDGRGWLRSLDDDALTTVGIIALSEAALAGYDDREREADGRYADDRAVARPLHFAGFMDMVVVVARNRQLYAKSEVVS